MYQCPKCGERLTNRIHPGQAALVATFGVIVLGYFAPRLVSDQSLLDALPLIILMSIVGGIATGIAFFVSRNTRRFRRIQWDE